MYVLRNIERCLRNHCCHRKAVRIIYYECVCVCSLSHPAGKSDVLCHTVIGDLSGSTIFFHTVSQMALFWKNIIQHKMCILILFTTFVGNTSHSKKNSARYYHKCT